MRDMTPGELHSIFDKGACPNCAGTSIVQGPRGGAMMNVQCATCEMEFSVAMYPGLRIGQVLREVEGYVPPAAPTPAGAQSPKADSVTCDGPLETDFYSVSAWCLLIGLIELCCFWIVNDAAPESPARETRYVPALAAITLFVLSFLSLRRARRSGQKVTAA
jgi:hypothetical protein